MNPKKRWRENKIKLTVTEVCDNDATKNNFEFPNRMSKCRPLKKLKSCLPQTPDKRASTLAAYLKTKSPTVKILEDKNIISTPQDQLASTIVDMKETIKKAKYRRSDDARAAVNLVTASESVQNIVKSRAKKPLAQALEVSQKRISRATTFRKKILHSESAAHEYTSRKTRYDALSDDNKKSCITFGVLQKICIPPETKTM